MQTVGDRVRIARKNAGLTQKELGKKSGTKQSVLSDLENGRNESSTNLVAIADAMSVSAKWLATGEGEMLDKPKPVILGTGNVEIIPQKFRVAPVLNYVQAGEFTDIFENTYDEYEYFYDEGFGLQVYWLYVRGDSMEPQFFEGEKILVDAEKVAKAGDYVIAMVNGDTQATFKKFKPCGYDEKLGREYCQLVALNDFYPPIDSRATEIKIIGVVVKHERKLA